MIEMVAVQVGPKPSKGFKRNKTAHGVLCWRDTRRWRGRKHVIWSPWKCEFTQEVRRELKSYFSLDLESELSAILVEEIQREMTEGRTWTLDELADAQDKAAELHKSIDWQ